MELAIGEPCGWRGEWGPEEDLSPAHVGDVKGGPLIHSNWMFLTSGNLVSWVGLAMAKFPGVAQAFLFR